ncbi:hypothetical protein TWF696_005723 [Orbilia brochopaga]|uniref:Glycosyl transferase family 25 domain-containing protein n=1 Tax=Orbilia brochopaga TaxID=3140254 RepID=A0AAV9UX54_9PEZI
MAVTSAMLNRRFTMILLACLAIPFIVVTMGHLGDSDVSRIQNSVLDSLHWSQQDGDSPQKQPPASSGKQEWSDMKFGSKDQDASGKRTQDAPAKTAEPGYHKDSAIPVMDDNESQVRNETLGFGSILMISLATRTDRRDAVSLIASQAGIKISHIIDAVRGEDIHQKAYPFGEARTKLPLPYLGSWRSHMDAFKYMVDNRVETALIIEDDIDWDIHVKDQLVAFSKALRSNPLRKPLTPEEVKRAPYGLDWDVMHLGTSRNIMAPPPLNRLFYRYDDPYSTPRTLTGTDNPCGLHFFCWTDILKQTKTADNQRVIFPSYEPVGLVALAVSFQGARKMLYDLSWRGLDTSMDFGVRDGCQRGYLKCWSVTPPIMSSWRVQGAGDSDLRNGGKGTPGVGVGNLQGEGVGLGWSARKQLQSEFEGHDYWKDGTIGWFGQGNQPEADDSFAHVETPAPPPPQPQAPQSPPPEAQPESPPQAPPSQEQST